MSIIRSFPNTIRQFIARHPYLIILAVIGFIYLPVINAPILRTTGDEKTYVAQALEMERAGHWFVQTLEEKPDYYKGPLHMILIRIGFLLFGHTMLATLYMNLLLLIASSFALFYFFKTLYADHATHQRFALFYATAYASSIGVYSHLFASQMESELISLYAITMVLLYFVSREPKNYWLLFSLWSVIALAGWLKSPLHSALLGSSVALFWLFNNEIRWRIRSLLQWLAIAYGIALSALGYLIIAYYDFDALIERYFLKESLSKGGNGMPVESAFLPLMTYFLSPWMFPAVLAMILGLFAFFIKNRTPMQPSQKEAITLGLSLILPTLLFFTIHPYRGEIYALPAISAMWLIDLTLWLYFLHRFSRAFRIAIWVNASILMLLNAAVLYLAIGYLNAYAWWNPLYSVVALLSLITIALITWSQTPRYQEDGAQLLQFSFIPFMLTLSLTLFALGKKDMADLKAFASTYSDPIGYYNLQHNVWSEWGYLNCWIAHDVVGIHTTAQLRQWLKSKRAIIVVSEHDLNVSTALLNDEKLSYSITPWYRWLTHGKITKDGDPRFIAYIKHNDIRLLEKSFYIIEPNGN